MKTAFFIPVLILSIMLAVPTRSLAEQLPEMIVEKMAVKFTRGMANLATCVVELPKQTIVSVRDMGAPGYLIGPLKGIGMTLYRGSIGAVEAIFFLVPQPGYYDSMITPTYVWDGWEDKRTITTGLQGEQ